MAEGKKHFGLDRNVFVAGLVSFFMDVSSEMIYPLVPLFLANVLGVNKSVIGLIEGVAESTASIFKVFSGWLSDRVGNRKWLMALGYGISALSRPIIALSTGWHQVISYRFVDRLGKGIRTAPRDTLIAESTGSDRLGRAFGFHRSMDTLGAVLGPALALYLLGRFMGDYRLVFWLSMVPALAAVMLIVFFITETGSPEPARRERPSAGKFGWRFKGFVAIATIFSLGNSSNAFLILKAESVGIEASEVLVVYLLFNVIYTSSSVLAGMAADRFGKKRMILLGYLLFAGLYFGFAEAASARAIWVLFATYGLFMGLTEGVQKAYLATIIPSGLKATAYGIYNAAVGIALLPASILGGWLWDNVSPAATFHLGTAMAGLSAVLFIVYIAAAKKLSA